MPDDLPKWQRVVGYVACDRPKWQRVVGYVVSALVLAFLVAVFTLSFWFVRCSGWGV